MSDFSEEAIPERDPRYQLPDAEGDDTEGQALLTGSEAKLWRWMVQRRPLLAILED